MERVISLLDKREEYFDGLIYGVSIDKLEMGSNVEAEIGEYLEARESLKFQVGVAKMIKSSCLEEIVNWREDLNKLFIEWHLQEEEMKEIQGILEEQQKVQVYRFGEDLSYFLTGNITNFFRWIQVSDDWYVLSFELYD